MKLEAITRREDLAGLAESWDALARKDARDGFFRTYAWYRAWMDHIRPDAEPFVVVARGEGGETVGLAPLCRLTYQDLGFRLEALAWAGREVVSGDYLDFLAEPSARGEIVAAMLRFLVEARGKWSLLAMGELIDEGETYRALEALGAEHDFPVRRQEERLCPYIELPGSFDEYLGSLGSSTRYHIRRRMRDCEKKGAEVVVHSRPEEIASRLDTLIRLHLARWNSDGLPGTFGRAGFAEFLRALLREPPAGSEFRLYEMTLGGEAVASLLAFHFGESALYYQAGWAPDSAVSALSPGVVLMAHSIRDAIEAGMRYYDFLRGDEDYKSRWTKTCRKTVTLLVAQSFMARRFVQMARLKDSVKQLRSGETEEATANSQ